MSSVSNDFRDVTTADLRLVRRLTVELMEASDLDALGRGLICGAGKILPADCMVWNVWTPAMDAMIGFEANDAAYREELERLAPALQATIHYHPVIAAGQFERSIARPQRMSDYQSGRAIRCNPLFREVYRHVDSNHQIAYTAAKLDHAQILLSWNRRSRDFTDREVQLLHLLGMQIGTLSGRIEERRYLRAAWDGLTAKLGAFTGTACLGADWNLGTKDGLILCDIIAGKSRAEIATALGWRRDTLDRHLGALRERLGFENHPQFLQALAALRASS